MFSWNLNYPVMKKRRSFPFEVCTFFLILFLPFNQFRCRLLRKKFISTVNDCQDMQSCVTFHFILDADTDQKNKLTSAVIIDAKKSE